LQQLILAIIGYLIILFAWGTICLVTYALSLAIKSKKPIQAISGLTQIVTSLLGIAITLYLIYFGIQLLIHGQILWLFVYIFIGFALITQLFTLIIMPFSFIPVFLEEHIKQIAEEEKMITGEILDEAKKIIDTSEGENTINRKLAIYFLIDYSLGLIYIATHPLQYHMLGWWDYVITPVIFILQGIIWIGLILLIYNKIRHHIFFYKNKRYWLIRIIQIDIILLIAIQALAALLLGLIK